MNRHQIKMWSKAENTAQLESVSFAKSDWRLCPCRSERRLHWPFTQVRIQPELTLAWSRSFKIPFWLCFQRTCQSDSHRELWHHRGHSRHGGTDAFFMRLCRHSCTRPTCTYSILIKQTIRTTAKNISICATVKVLNEWRWVQLDDRNWDFYKSDSIFDSV